MKYRIILTHNPQDFFNGIEDPELTERYDFNTSVESCIAAMDKILWAVGNGYKTIVLSKEGDDTG